MTAASAFPDRPLRYVVPFAPGGPPDAIARVVAPALSQAWGQPVLVDNRPGANGNLGSEFVVNSPPDGCTLLQGSSATHGSNAVLFPLLPFDPHADLAPVVPLIEGPLYLAVSDRMAAGTLAELVAHARAHPGEVRFATAGPGSPHHLAGELLRVRADIGIVPVHYPGAAQALRAIVQGDVEVYFGSDFMARPEARKLRLLAVSTRWRWPLAPQIPTLVECGISDFEIHGWFGLFVPASTPADVVLRINADVNRVLATPEVAGQIEAFGYRPLGGTPGEFAARLQRETSHWAELVRRNRISLV
jgi:tripartite-type tricarboxylate transporter receptor subunit TctC